MRPTALLLLLASCAAAEPDYLPFRTRPQTAGKSGPDGGGVEYERIVSRYEGLPPDVEPDAPDRRGIPPLFAAVFGGDASTARALLDRGADPNGAVARGRPCRLDRPVGKAFHSWDVAGWSPLHQAAYFRDRHLMTLLLARGADVDALTPDGRTPLMLAASNPYEEEGGRAAAALRLLLDAGADPERVDRSGRRALDHARRHVPPAAEALERRR